jgi:hypothetical protein
MARQAADENTPMRTIGVKVVSWYGGAGRRGAAQGGLGSPTTSAASQKSEYIYIAVLHRLLVIYPSDIIVS